MAIENKPQCYLSVRIKNAVEAYQVEAALVSAGIVVHNPCSITPTVPHDEMPKAIADTCYEMIDAADFVVLIVKEGANFGNDCATEIGNARGKNKKVFVYAEGVTKHNALEAFAEKYPEDKTIFMLEDFEYYSDTNSLAQAITLRWLARQ